MLTVQHLHKRFGEAVVLHELALQVRPGEIVGIMGSNGAGKTTLFRLLCGLLPCDAGMIDYQHEGQPLPLGPSIIGYLPESRSLFEDVGVGRTLTFWARLRGMPAHRARQASEHWLGRIGLLPHAAERVSTLSKGNLQKLQLAACMIHSPRLLVLDEPFSGLDPINQITVVDLISQAAQQGAAVLLSAHHVELLHRFASRVLVLRAGYLHPAADEGA